MLALMLYSALVATSLRPIHSNRPRRFRLQSLQFVRVNPCSRGISRPVNGAVRVNRAPLRRIIQFAYDIDPQLHDPLPVVVLHGSTMNCLY